MYNEYELRLLDVNKEKFIKKIDKLYSLNQILSTKYEHTNNTFLKNFVTTKKHRLSNIFYAGN